MGIELTINLALLAGAIFCFWEVGNGVNPSPIPGAMTAADWPRLILTGLIIALVVNINTLLKAPKKPGGTKEIALSDLVTRKFLAATGMLVGYALVIDYLGFLVSTFIFVGLLSSLIGLRRPVALFLGAFLSTSTLYALFQLGLSVMLPRGVGIFRELGLWFEILAT